MTTLHTNWCTNFTTLLIFHPIILWSSKIEWTSERKTTFEERTKVPFPKFPFFSVFMNSSVYQYYSHGQCSYQGTVTSTAHFDDYNYMDFCSPVFVYVCNPRVMEVVPIYVGHSTQGHHDFNVLWLPVDWGWWMQGIPLQLQMRELDMCSDVNLVIFIEHKKGEK